MREATEVFQAAGWTLPPAPRWDVTDFGLGDWERYGLVLVNLADEPEYCEKLMYARKGMETPAHCHAKKKEDIIARRGILRITLWKNKQLLEEGVLSVKVNGEAVEVASGSTLEVLPGCRITLAPGVYHAFAPAGDGCVIGEVSTANDDVGDNFFVDSRVGRYSRIEEDEAAVARLIGE